MKFTPPAEVKSVLANFASLFTRPTWSRVQALVCGVLLSSNSTITAALRFLNLGEEPRFENFHRVLNRACWSAFKAMPILLNLLIGAFAPPGEPLVFGIDETIERRWGKRITARAIYRDAARSSKSCVQKTSGLRWMSVHLLVPVRWAKRIWALPVLTALCPSKRYKPFAQKGRCHKSITRRARGLIGAIWRVLGSVGLPLIFVADTTYSALELLGWCAKLGARCASRSFAFITRLRLDAALYKPAPKGAPGQKGRKRLKGERLPSLSERLKKKTIRWSKVMVPWYGCAGFVERKVQIATGTAVWYHAGIAPVPVRWVLIRDPEKKFEPQALLSTNLALLPEKIVEYFVRRWQMEVTFEEASAHLGVPGQRQWNDRAIERSTPIRLALFSFVSLIAEQQEKAGRPIQARHAAWYPKALPTFSDALAAVRRLIWAQMHFSMSDLETDMEKPPREFFLHLAELLCYAA